MAKMRAVQVSRAGGPLELVERRVPDPGPGQVRVRIEACGVCHSDVLTKEGLWPGLQYPRVPGHEIAGVVDEVGKDVRPWKAGERVGVGWHGGHCGYCSSCRRGDFLFCKVSPKVTGIAIDGGYEEFAVIPAEALARIPDGLSPVEAAPLMDAGVTTFNALRNAGARSGDLVAVLGIGGLGHLGIQFAAKMGFDVVAIARGGDKEALARKLGARIYIDSRKQNPSVELARLGGVRLVLATATDGAAMTAALGGLGVNGRLLVVGAPQDPLQVPAGTLIGGSKSVAGWASGRSIDSEDTLDFAMKTGVRSMNEVYPFEKAADAYDRMLSGDARFRVVMSMRT